MDTGVVPVAGRGVDKTQAVTRPMRFGYQTRTVDPVSLRAEARRAEDAGFDVFCTFDHLGRSFSALAPLVVAAEATSRIRVCPLVLNHDFHHPVLLAQELATIDRLTGGRLEIGVGAGHAFTEYTAAGVRFDPARIRKERMAEATIVLRKLLAGGPVSFTGRHYHVDSAEVLTPLQGNVPLLIGVNGRDALRHAALHADIVGLTMLGRTLSDGVSHEPKWAAADLDTTVDHIRSCAGPRWDHLELNALIQVIEVTDDREPAGRRLAEDLGGLPLSDVLKTPFLALGTVEEIASHLLDCRRRWGISYFVGRDLEALAPVIARVRQREKYVNNLR